MIIKRRKFLFFTSLRIILDDELLKRAFKQKKHLYISAISYNKFDFGPDVKIKNKKTSVIDLTQSLDDIFNKFKKNTRNEIRKTDNITGLKIVINDRSLREIYNLHKKFERGQGRKPLAISSFKESVFFSAYYNKKLISCVACYHDNLYIRIRLIFSTRLFKKGNDVYTIIGYSTRRLVWEACKYGKLKNNILLDMGAVNFDDAKKEGITNFKMDFGGKVVDEYSYIYKNKVVYFFNRLFI